MGIVFYEMLHARTPWTGADLQDLKVNIATRKIEFKPSINPEIKNLISKMVALESKDRISWEELFKHPLFAVTPTVEIQKEKLEISFNEIRNIFLKYLKSYIVKSYLRINVEKEVIFS
jgi:calcium-dependent protein kinase